MKKVIIILVLYVELFVPTITYANYFLEAGVDTVISIAKFKIRFVDEYAKKFGIKEIKSHQLIDKKSKIGRSRSHFDGNRGDLLTGVFVCQDGERDMCFNFFGTRVKDRDFTMVPPTDDIAFDKGPNGTKEIHTQILSLNLTDIGECGTKSANAIRAGNIIPDMPRSLGEVESLNSPNSMTTYPVEGFFNLFVEVDVDWNKDGIVDMTLFNNYPIITQNSYLDHFPSNVFYIHDSNNFAIPVYEKNHHTHVGWITIEGQNIDSECDNSQINKDIFDKKPLSVELSSFTAKGNEESVSLKWETKTEIGCNGYHLWRAKKNEMGEYIEITKLTEQLIPSKGGILNETVYFYEDSDVVRDNTYFYGLEDIAEINTIHFELIASTTTGDNAN